MGSVCFNISDALTDMDYRGLTIGDWLLDKEEGFARRVVQVTDAAFDGCGAGVILENGMDYQECEPIPLTAEILEKNGFVTNRGITSWKFETEKEDLIDIYGYKEYHLSINIEDTHGSGKGYRWMLNNLVIFYVHELQHAFKLCGIDKEIIL